MWMYIIGINWEMGNMGIYIVDWGNDFFIYVLVFGLDFIVYSGGYVLKVYSLMDGMEWDIGLFFFFVGQAWSMMLWEGELYMMIMENDLVCINCMALEQSELLYSFLDSVGCIELMLIYFFVCDSIVIYVFEYIGDDFGFLVLYVLDFIDYFFSFVCIIGYFIIGIVLFEEVIMFFCDFYVDLDIDDSSSVGLDFVLVFFCCGFIFLIDMDLQVYG